MRTAALYYQTKIHGFIEVKTTKFEASSPVLVLDLTTPHHLARMETAKPTQARGSLRRIPDKKCLW